MKPINRLSGVLFLLVITITLSAQSGTESAILCGKVLFEPDSIYPLKPYSIIVEKDWPITFSQFEQQRIDTTDYSFSIRMEPEELTYGSIIINFFSDVDTISKEERGHWMSSQRPDIFVNSDGMITEYASRILFTGLKFVLEPGDSLHMLIDYNKKDINGRASVHFSGSGSANNKLCRSMSVFGLDSKSFRFPLKEGLSYEDDELAGEISAAEIENASDALKKSDKNSDGKLTEDELRPEGGPGFGGPGQGRLGGQGRGGFGRGGGFGAPGEGGRGGQGGPGSV